MIEFQVTYNDINNGDRNCKNCPVARAAKRHFKTKIVSVGKRTICVNGNVYLLDKNTEEFIDKFDSWYRVSPITVSMEKF